MAIKTIHLNRKLAECTRNKVDWGLSKVVVNRMLSNLMSVGPEVHPPQRPQHSWYCSFQYVIANSQFTFMNYSINFNTYPTFDSWCCHLRTAFSTCPKLPNAFDVRLRQIWSARTSSPFNHGSSLPLPLKPQQTSAKLKYLSFVITFSLSKLSICPECWSIGFLNLRCRHLRHQHGHVLSTPWGHVIWLL
jgi:hypothetical protein